MKKYVFLRFPDFKMKAFTMSFDDGMIEDERLISIFDKYGIKGTFNLNSMRIQEPIYERSVFKVKDVRSLYFSGGHEVAVHGVRHLSLGEVDSAAAVYDVVEDRRLLEGYFGKIVMGMAYANGSYDEQAKRVLKCCNIKYARTVRSTYEFSIPADWLEWDATCHQRDEKLFDLAEQFLLPNNGINYMRRSPQLFYVWGHSYEFNCEEEWERIERFCQKIGGKESVWYATNGEIYDYVRAYNRLEFSVCRTCATLECSHSGTLVHNPSAIDVYICYYDKNYKIGAGQTVTLD